MGHKKLDRMLALAAQWRIPIVLFAEGGGGRPNDTDMPLAAGLDTPSFLAFAALSGVAPRVGIASGRRFAGNAALLGCCDVVIATENSSIGMGGPAMIEGGGLGTCTPEEVGPIGVQSKNGVVDIRVADEAEAVAVAKNYLAYFQGPLATWTCDDQTKLRDILPERRRRAYKIRPIIELIADSGSVLELRKEFGVGIVTALIRIEGRALDSLPTIPCTLVAPLMLMLPTRPRALCNYATHSVCLLCHYATPLDSWLVRKQRRLRSCGMFRECSSLRVVYAFRFFRLFCAKVMGLERKQWREVTFMRRFSRLRGPRVNSAEWASKER